MKKLSFTLLMFFVSISIFAQLYVKDTGNVGVNMNNPENITLGMLNTRNQYGMRIEGHGEKDLLIHSYSDTITNHTTTKYGLEICTHLQNNNINNGITVYSELVIETGCFLTDNQWWYCQNFPWFCSTCRCNSDSPSRKNRVI